MLAGSGLESLDDFDVWLLCDLAQVVLHDRVSAREARTPQDLVDLVGARIGELPQKRVDLLFERVELRGTWCPFRVERFKRRNEPGRRLPVPLGFAGDRVPPDIEPARH